jgi:hypothetical protein
MAGRVFHSAAEQQPEKPAIHGLNLSLVRSNSNHFQWWIRCEA